LLLVVDRAGTRIDEIDPDRAELESEINRRLWAMLRLTEADWYKVAIVGADHLYFSDITAIFDPPPPGGIAPRRAHAVVNAFTLHFFDRYLKGVDTTPLLSARRVSRRRERPTASRAAAGRRTQRRERESPRGIGNATWCVGKANGLLDLITVGTGPLCPRPSPTIDRLLVLHGEFVAGPPNVVSWPKAAAQMQPMQQVRSDRFSMQNARPLSKGI
jgi:hypothetical protein